MHMNNLFRKCFTIILLLVAIQADSASEAFARGVPFSFDSVWFYRDGTRVVPEISKLWITVVFDPASNSDFNEFDPANDANNSYIRKKAKLILQSNAQLTEYLYDPNIAENSCFFRMRKGLKPGDIHHLINLLSRDRAVRYVHPTLALDNKTFAFFNLFELEWKTGTPEAERESLLRATHALPDENDEKGKRYSVDVTAIPFFRALNLLAEDVRVVRATPHLVEIKPSISTRLSLFMSGGNIGDSIPFSLTTTFTDRVSIDPSSIATLNLRPPELQKELFDCTFDPYDYAKAVTKSPIIITGRLQFYAPGEHTIPAVKISYSCPSCSDNGVRSIETEPVIFKVSSIMPAVKSEYRLIVPTDPVSPDYRLASLEQQSRRYRWLSIIAFAGLVPCAAWAFLLRHKASAEQERRERRKMDGQVAEQLTALLQARPTAPHWIYLGEIGALLREYLVLHQGIDAKYRGGSGKQFMETVRAQLPPECLGPLSAVLIAIDNSVALEAEQYQEMDQLQRDILHLVESIAHNGTGKG
jgi:hypothetical protein